MSQSCGFPSFLLYLFKFIHVGSRIKIKTYTLLLAWLVIFAHSVIPHHHSDDNCIQTADCRQSATSAYDELVKSAEFTNQPADLKVCHLSNLLFQNFNPENLLPISAAETITIPLCISGKIYINSTVSFISPQSCSTVGFRAPPAA